jgi:protein-tyrosine phosphatase
MIINYSDFKTKQDYEQFKTYNHNIPLKTQYVPLKPTFSGVSLPVAIVWDRLFSRETPQLLQRVLQVDKNLFRGPNPGIEGLEKLKNEKNINVIINLRLDSESKIRKLKEKAQNLGLEYHNISFNSFTVPKKEKVDEVFRIIENAKKRGLNVYVHCLHGFDRTGTIIALYRIKKQGKNFAEAFQEMLDLGHKKHRRLFPKLGQFIEQEAKAVYA